MWVAIAASYMVTRYAAHAVLAFSAFYFSSVWMKVLAGSKAPLALGWMAGVAFSGFTFLNVVLHLDLLRRYRRDKKDSEFFLQVEAADGEDSKLALWEARWEQLRRKEEERKNNGKAGGMPAEGSSSLGIAPQLPAGAIDSDSKKDN